MFLFLLHCNLEVCPIIQLPFKNAPIQKWFYINLTISKKKYSTMHLPKSTTGQESTLKLSIQICSSNIRSIQIYMYCLICTFSLVKFSRHLSQEVLWILNSLFALFSCTAHIIGSASWLKIMNFQYHLSVIVMDPLGIHFLPIGL